MAANHARQVHPALLGWDIGDVSCPHLVGLLGMQVARQQIVGNGQLVFALWLAIVCRP